MSGKGAAAREYRVATGPIRRLIEESGLTYTEVAHRMGWVESVRGGAERGTATRLKRAVGAAPDSKSGRYAETMVEEAAVGVLRALHVDPRDVGL